jgi:sigma-B regulation protein RsbU (phosphoserine phosphatase)
MVDDSVGVVIGDVSGHGFGPALLMAAMRSYLRALALTHVDLGTIFGLLNRALCMDVPEGRFATLLLGRLDAACQTFTYASAGHPSGYVLDASGRMKQELGSTGVPLGILPEEAYESADPVQLSPGDIVVLVTDGILEAPGEQGSLFGTSRLLHLVRSRRHEPARGILDSLCRAVREHSGAAPQADDMTAIVIKVGPAPVGENSGDPDQAMADAVADFTAA